MFVVNLLYPPSPPRLSGCKEVTPVPAQGPGTPFRFSKVRIKWPFYPFSRKNFRIWPSHNVVSDGNAIGRPSYLGQVRVVCEPDNVGTLLPHRPARKLFSRTAVLDL